MNDADIKDKTGDNDLMMTNQLLEIVENPHPTFDKSLIANSINDNFKRLTFQSIFICMMKSPLENHPLLSLHIFACRPQDLFGETESGLFSPNHHYRPHVFTFLNLSTAFLIPQQ